jgi:hypothetical protein
MALTGVMDFGAGDGDGDVIGIAERGEVPVGIRRNCLDLGGVWIRGGVGLHSSLYTAEGLYASAATGRLMSFRLAARGVSCLIEGE